MGTCEVCGNEYEKAFEVVAAGARHVFDSFECAIHKMAPVCEHCRAGSSVMGSRPMATSTVAPVVPGWLGCTPSGPSKPGGPYRSGGS
jgi:hypothetical protein